jgi:hypothetical protein
MWWWLNFHFWKEWFFVHMLQWDLLKKLSLLHNPILHTQCTKQGCQIFLGPNIPTRKKYTRWPQTISRFHKLYQMDVKYSKWSKALATFSFLRSSKFTKIGIFSLKINHLATLIPRWINVEGLKSRNCGILEAITLICKLFDSLNIFYSCQEL